MVLFEGLVYEMTHDISYFFIIFHFDVQLQHTLHHTDHEHFLAFCYACLFQGLSCGTDALVVERAGREARGQRDTVPSNRQAACGKLKYCRQLIV